MILRLLYHYGHWFAGLEQTTSVRPWIPYTDATDWQVAPNFDFKKNVQQLLNFVRQQSNDS